MEETVGRFGGSSSAHPPLKPHLSPNIDTPNPKSWQPDHPLDPLNLDPPSRSGLNRLVLFLQDPELPQVFVVLQGLWVEGLRASGFRVWGFRG